MNYAVVDKTSNKAVAIINQDFKAYFEVYFPMFNIIEIESVGNSTFSTEEGTISTISIHPVGKNFSEDAYHIIGKCSKSISLTQAYNLIKK